MGQQKTGKGDRTIDKEMGLGKESVANKGLCFIFKRKDNEAWIDIKYIIYMLVVQFRGVEI